MKVKIFNFHDGEHGSRDKVEEVINEFLSDGVQVKNILQTSAPCPSDESPNCRVGMETVITIFYEES